LATAWTKYHEGRFDDACKIAGYIIQEPILHDLQGSPIEFKVLLTEIRMLILHCQMREKSDKDLINIPGITFKNIHDFPHFQNQGTEIIEHGPLQTALNIVKLTNTLSVYFSGSKCSQELSRVALALRTYTISLKSREMMTQLNGQVGLASEMKMFGKSTVNLTRELTFSTR
jgi:hypothetical protein